MSWYESNTKTDTAEAIITIQKNSPHLIYPAGLVSVETASDVSFRADPFSEKIDMVKEGSSTTLNKYKVTYNAPHFSIENLKAVKAAESLEASSYFIEKYTQLPDSLPKRVKDLAVNLTKDKNNRYDQVLAVEDYFANHSFVYETEHVKVPGKGQDYVDQFIFDTKSGYCNNFSTSMVVLLRSIGIPARWVKGYTGGTLENKLTNSDYENMYTITNNDAHSWVEVYFPTYGWIPFEPTKGFSNPYNFTHDTSAPTATSPNSNTTIPSNEQIPQRNAEAKQKSLIEDTEVPSNGKITNSKKGFPWGYLFLCIILISITGYTLFTTRIKWFAFFIILSYKYRKGDAIYIKAYSALLKQLESAGISRTESQTLREYAIHVDKLYNSTDMQKLTLSYENVIYQNNRATSEWRKSVQLWEKLMKKASSPPKSNEFDTFS
ncbi:Membrane-bound protease [Bacillus cereus Rock3-44]|nr:Membrane-bound protease [Bacillus cereus Rock3-44]